MKVTVPGPREFFMMHRSVRFTDATSNFGWSAAVSEVMAQMADRAIVSRRESLITQCSTQFFSFRHGCTDCIADHVYRRAAKIFPRGGEGAVEFFVVDVAEELGVGGGTASSDGSEGAALAEEASEVESLAGSGWDLRSVHRSSRA
jgi:hypothetical protein